MSVFAVGDGRPTRTKERTVFVAVCDFCHVAEIAPDQFSANRLPTGWATHWLESRADTCPKHGGIVPGYYEGDDKALNARIHEIGMNALGITLAEREEFGLDDGMRLA